SAAGAVALAAATPDLTFAASPGATSRANRKVPYGAAIALADLEADARLGSAIANHCSHVVPVSELQWSDLRPAPGVFDFDRADRIAAFASGNGLTMRGHTLVWYAAMPDWTKEITDAAAAERLLVEHIETVVSRYRGRIHSWDVVNEAIPDVPAGPTDRRP